MFVPGHIITPYTLNTSQSQILVTPLLFILAGHQKCFVGSCKEQEQEV